MSTATTELKISIYYLQYLVCVCNAIQFIMVVVGVINYTSGIIYIFCRRRRVSSFCDGCRNFSTGIFGSFVERVIDQDNISSSSLV